MLWQVNALSAFGSIECCVGRIDRCSLMYIVLFVRLDLSFAIDQELVGYNIMFIEVESCIQLGYNVERRRRWVASSLVLHAFVHSPKYDTLTTCNQQQIVP